MARQYKTGWVYSTDWNQVKFGNSPGNDITHNFGVTPENIQARVYLRLAPSGTVYEVPDVGVTVYAEDDDTSTITVRNAYSNAVKYKQATGGHSLVYNGTGAWYQVVLDNTAETVAGPTGATGATGADGADGTTTVVYACDYDHNADYAIGDLVYSNGDVYKCIQTKHGGSGYDPPDISRWEVLPKTYTTENEPTAVDGSLWIKE